MWGAKKVEVPKSDAKVVNVPAAERMVTQDVFPRPETLAKLEELIARRVELTAKCKPAAERRLRLAQSEKSAIEALGNDPSTVIRDRRREVEAIDRELEQLRNEIYQLCQAEHDRFAAIKSQEFVRCRTEFVLPNVERISAVIEVFKKAVNDLAVEFQTAASPDLSSNLARAARLDVGCKTLNAAMDRAGAPANYRISAEESLVTVVANSLQSELRNAISSLEADFNKLRAVANLEKLKTSAEWQKPEPQPVTKPLAPNDPANWPRDLLRKPDGSNFPG